LPELVSTLATLARQRIVSGGIEVSRALDEVFDEAVEAEPGGRIGRPSRGLWAYATATGRRERCLYATIA
jgi:hypothetical protein